MKRLETFEGWNENIIDKSLFLSGKAKYNPKVISGKIYYKTGNITPYYFAEIDKVGNKFICKIYKRKKNGEEKRLRNKLKKDLKLAHNYVREFLNQRLKKDKEKKSNDLDKMNVIRGEESKYKKIEPMEFTAPIHIPQPKNKTILRKFY